VLGHRICKDPTFFGRGRGDGGRTQQQTCIEKHLTAANCIYLASRGFAPRPPLWLHPWTPHRLPVPALTSEPGYTTGDSITVTSALLKIITTILLGWSWTAMCLNQDIMGELTWNFTRNSRPHSSGVSCGSKSVPQYEKNFSVRSVRRA